MLVSIPGLYPASRERVAQEEFYLVFDAAQVDLREPLETGPYGRIQPQQKRLLVRHRGSAGGAAPAAGRAPGRGHCGTWKRRHSTNWQIRIDTTRNATSANRI